MYVQAFRKSESILGNNKQALIADFAPDKKVKPTEILYAASGGRMFVNISLHALYTLIQALDRHLCQLQFQLAVQQLLVDIPHH